MSVWRTLPVALLALGCTVGEGEGWVRSEHLFIEECWSGPFDLGLSLAPYNPHCAPGAANTR